jgi:hypothetical protein
MAQRKYQPAWKRLKEDKVILVAVTTSTTPEVIKKFASTFIRGIQKEKYLDTVFRGMYNDAVLTSSISLTNSTVRIELDLKDYNSVLEDMS